MSENHKNILGTEMEWAIMARLRGSSVFKPLNGDGGMPQPANMISSQCLPGGVSSCYSYLSNGARYYGDVGGHVEYATPENLTLDDVVLSEFAGERLVAEALHNYLKTERSVDEAILHKRVVDDKGTTWGYHVNVSEERKYFMVPGEYSVGNRLSFEDKLRPLLFHYATSLALLGSGVVYSPIRPGEHRFSLGQKVTDIQFDVNGSTTSQKPFISTRDEPHADAKFIRLHVVGTDPHISPWATRMMMGTTTLMLAGIKQGVVRELEYDISTHSPAMHIAHQAKYDVRSERKYDFRTVNGVKKYTDYEVQAMYIDDLSGVDMTDDQKRTLEQWQEAVSDQREDIMKLSGRSDAITKLDLIQSRNRRSNRAEDDYSEEAKALDKAYSTIVRVRREDVGKKSVDDLMDATVAGYLRRTKFVKYMPSRDDVTYRVINPPKNTRAAVRAGIITDPQLKGVSARLHNIGWGYYSIYKDNKTETVQMDPWIGVE